MRVELCRQTLMKNVNTEEGVLPYKSPVNLCTIYQFATDNVTSNTTVKRNTCSFDNKCEKLWIAVYNQSALLRICQSATTNNIKTHQTSTKAARSLTWALRHRGSMFQPQTMAYCVVSVTSSADPQTSSLHVNNIETRTAINDTMPPDEYQALLWGPQWICVGSLLK